MRMVVVGRKKWGRKDMWHFFLPLLGHSPKEIKSLSLRDVCNPVFFASLFPITNIWKFLCIHKNVWKDKENIYAQWNTTQPSNKRKSCNFLTAQLKVEDILIEINQTQKESDCLITTNLRNLKYSCSSRLRTEWCLPGSGGGESQRPQQFC